MQIVTQVTNLFDRKYYTAGQLGPFGFTDTGAFIARPLPPINGQFRSGMQLSMRQVLRSDCGWVRDSSSEWALRVPMMRTTQCR
jgi:hypothetical protein